MNWEKLIYEKCINLHYAKRYVKFIKRFDNTGGKIKHHILPKASDFWPEFINLKENRWNESKLTDRQHYIAHWILWKALGKSQVQSFWAMTNQNGERINSKIYSLLREDFSNQMSNLQKEKAINNKHNFQKEEWLDKLSKLKFEQSKNGNHVWQTEEHREFMKNWNAEQIKNGTHPLQTHAGENSKQRIKDGTHNLLTENPAKKAQAEGNHWLSGIVNVVDKNGVRKKVSKEVYNKQTGNKEDWEFVHCSSNEAKKRLNK